MPHQHPQNIPVLAPGQMSSAAAPSLGNGGNPLEEEDQPEIDFFADMTPKLKKTVSIRWLPIDDL